MILLGILFLLWLVFVVIFILYVVKTDERIEQLERKNAQLEQSVEILAEYRRSRISERVQRNKFSSDLRLLKDASS